MDFFRNKKRKTAIYTSFKSLVLFMVLTGLMITSCKTTKKVSGPEQNVQVVENDSTANTKDSTEYELMVLDQGFESFLAMQPPKDYHSQQYYENRNYRYVIEWNRRHDNALRHGSFYETRIDYNPNIDYGLELNYKLYYYFKFIEKEYGIKLIEGTPR